MTLRPATPADAVALRAMMAESNGYDLPEARAMIRAYSAAWSVGAETWILEEDGQLLGFHDLLPHEDGLELDLFFTADAVQGRGVGRRLFRHVADRARVLGARQVVIGSNPSAADFYRRMGAREAGLCEPMEGITYERPRFVLDLPVLRPATLDDAPAVARLHREATRTAMPWLPDLHTPAEDLAFFRDQVLPRGPVWTAEVAGVFAGFIALKPGWVDHLAVGPAFQGTGVGSALLDQAKAEQVELHLWTFQRNTRARAFYEARGFILERLTDGAHNEEKEPDALYVWRA